MRRELHHRLGQLLPGEFSLSELQLFTSLRCSCLGELTDDEPFSTVLSF